MFYPLQEQHKREVEGVWQNFGKCFGCSYEEGLVDSTSPEDFNARLENCKDTRNTREASNAPARGPRFYSYFVHYRAQEVCYSMCKDVREAAGLGSPPVIFFTTNASESTNTVMKPKVNYKETEWPAQQQREVVWSLSGRGQYRLCTFLCLPQHGQKWSRSRGSTLSTNLTKLLWKVDFHSLHSLPLIFQPVVRLRAHLLHWMIYNLILPKSNWVLLLTK